MRLDLNKRSGDAVRMLIHLASVAPDVRVTSADLGKACDVTPGNVPTLVALLARAGLVDAAAGRSGGCRLARPAEEITIAEVIEALEGSLSLSRCAIDDRRCTDREYHCGLHRLWSESHATLIVGLQGLSLADVARRQDRNRRAVTS